MAKQQGPNLQELQRIKDLLSDIERTYKKIGLANPFSGKEAKDFVDNVGVLKDELEKANDILHDMDGGIGDITKSWKAILDEVKGYKNTINSSKSSISSLSSISEKLKEHQKGLSSLSSKQLKSLQEQYRVEKDRLKSNQQSLSQTINDLSQKDTLTEEELKKLVQSQTIYNNVNSLLEEKDSILQETNKLLNEESKLTGDIEKKTGVLGGTLKGISKIPILGNMFDANEALKAAEGTIRNGGKAVNGMGAAFKNIGGQIKTGLLNPANLALGFITQMAAALKITDDGAGKLAKDFNLTYSEALNVRRELGTIAATSMDAALNTKNLQETLTFVGSQLGSNAKLNEADLKTFTKLREQAGYTNEELYGIQQMSLLNGKSLEQNTKEVLGGAQAYASRNKLVINEKQVLRDVSKASASLKLTLGGSAEAVAEAAVRARQFGLNLEQAEKISQSLLQFESSIESELSAELLTGRDLNFERARGLALNGETAKAAEEIAKQVGTSADFAKMNVIQQEAIAKAAGMERNELAQSLMDREALAKLSGVEGATAQERFNNLVKEVGMEEAKKRLGDEGLANQYEQQSVQDRFNQSVEKLQEIFIQLAEPMLAIVSPFVDLLTNILPGITLAIQTLLKPIQWIADLIGLIGDGFKWVGDKIGALIGPLGTVGKIMKGLASLAIVYAAYKAYASLAALPIIGVPLGIAAAAAVTTAGFGLLSGIKADDMLSPGGSGGGYGKRTLLGPEGAIQLNDKDTVIAGTNLFDKADDMVSSPKGSVTVSNKTAPKKETPIDTNAGTNARLDALIAMTGKVNSVSTLKIQ
jgi:uncharacterized protein YukE